MDHARDVAGRESAEHRGLIAAYREGLGLAAVAVISDRAGIRIAAAASDLDEENESERVNARWWCRRGDAARVAAAATTRMRRRESSGGPAAAPANSGSRHAQADCTPIQLAFASVCAAAKQLNVALKSDNEISAEAMDAVLRVDSELQKLQRAGELKSINRAYRAYRLEATGQGVRIQRYDDWMRKYRENLVREVAATLRSF
jgi:hypothetical protein